jgi:protein arginine N-methyltransferase 1
VYALETSDAIATAQEIAVSNRIETIEFIQATSTAITLPERADVIVSDLRGVLPFLRDHLSVIIDARQRHLAPGGTIIPHRDEVYAALAEAPEEYDRISGPWQRHSRGFYMQAGRRVVMNTWRRADITRDQLLCEPQRWATIDYSTIDSPNVRSTITLRPLRAGVAHGLVVWFDAVLADGIGYSNAPGADGAGHGRGFFPFADALEVMPGDRIVVELTAERDGTDYAWTWTSMLYRGDAAEPKTTQHQSTLLARPLDRIRKRSASHVPLLNAEGAINAAILQAMNGDATSAEIATELTIRFADRFHSHADALARVSDLAERYSL